MDEARPKTRPQCGVRQTPDAIRRRGRRRFHPCLNCGVSLGPDAATQRRQVVALVWLVGIGVALCAATLSLVAWWLPVAMGLGFAGFVVWADRRVRFVRQQRLA